MNLKSLLYIFAATNLALLAVCAYIAAPDSEHSQYGVAFAPGDASPDAGR